VEEFTSSRETNWAPGTLHIKHRVTKDTQLQAEKHTMPQLPPTIPDLVDLENAA
jgi:hypothetical protein